MGLIWFSKISDSLRDIDADSSKNEDTDGASEDSSKNEDTDAASEDDNIHENPNIQISAQDNSQNDEGCHMFADRIFVENSGGSYNIKRSTMKKNF